MESCKLRRQKWWFLIIYYIPLAMIITTTHSAVLGFPYDTVEMILTYKNREKSARKPWHNRETPAGICQPGNVNWETGN